MCRKFAIVWILDISLIWEIFGRLEKSKICLLKFNVVHNSVSFRMSSNLKKKKCGKNRIIVLSSELHLFAYRISRPAYWIRAKKKPEYNYIRLRHNVICPPVSCLWVNHQRINNSHYSFNVERHIYVQFYN